MWALGEGNFQDVSGLLFLLIRFSIGSLAACRSFLIDSLPHKLRGFFNFVILITHHTSTEDGNKRRIFCNVILKAFDDSSITINGFGALTLFLNPRPTVISEILPKN